jgi:hypothetical protein
LPSVVKAHQFQICNNFKDKSIQCYGGELFRQLQNISDDIFCKLPPPPPSIVQTVVNNTEGSNNVSMSRYYDRDGGCFDGDGFVSLADGSMKQVKHLKKGDYIKSKVNLKKICVILTNSN